MASVYVIKNVKKNRCEQGSNLRGETPLDFKSNALTTRPSQHVTIMGYFSINYPCYFFVHVYVARIHETNMAKNMEEVDEMIAKLSGPS